jgi:hypothetical protein
MFFPTTDKKLSWKIRFMAELAQTMAKHRKGIDTRNARPEILDAFILHTIIEGNWTLGENGGKAVAVTALADILCQTGQVIKSRLRVLARAGIIGVVGGWDKNHRRKPTEVFLHPAFLQACCEARPLGKLGPMLEFFAKTFTDRLDHIGDIQGFSDEVPYGQMELGFKAIALDALPDSQPVRELKNLQGATVADSAAIKKRNEAFYWRRLSLDFVRSAADYWVAFRSSRGYGNERPSWDGENVCPTQKKIQLDLVKLFQQHGGRNTAVAWMIFCGTKREDDSHGRPEFKPDKAYGQFTGSDKRPDQFAKYFDLILGDPSFRLWIQDGKILTKARQYWDDSLDIKPREYSNQSTTGKHWTERSSQNAVYEAAT